MSEYECGSDLVTCPRCLFASLVGYNGDCEAVLWGEPHDAVVESVASRVSQRFTACPVARDGDPAEGVLLARGGSVQLAETFFLQFAVAEVDTQELSVVFKGGVHRSRRAEHRRIVGEAAWRNRLAVGRMWPRLDHRAKACALHAERFEEIGSHQFLPRCVQLLLDEGARDDVSHIRIHHLRAGLDMWLLGEGSLCIFSSAFPRRPRQVVDIEERHTLWRGALGRWKAPAVTQKHLKSNCSILFASVGKDISHGRIPSQLTLLDENRREGSGYRLRVGA